MYNSIDYYNHNALTYFERTVLIDMTDLYEPFLSYLPKLRSCTITKKLRKSGFQNQVQDLSKKVHILDAGCGGGRDTKYFTSLGYNVTAIDASQAMVIISSKFTGQKTILMAFEDINFVNCFDGIWASASLLHVPRKQMHLVFKKMITAIKDGGIWYLSFKVGMAERIDKDGRFFNDYNEQTFREFLNYYQDILEIISINSTVTRKDNCLSEEWLNILLRVNKSRSLD